MAQDGPAPRRPGEIQVDAAKMNCTYANFCRVLGTPEELIVDFGLNTQAPGNATEPVAVTQRIVMNFYTAKRLLQALGMSVQRFEQTFGALETDVSKRVVHAGSGKHADG